MKIRQARKIVERLSLYRKKLDYRTLRDSTRDKAESAFFRQQRRITKARKEAGE
jgi:hypothetical protein